MTDSTTFSAQKRDILGKKVAQLRREGSIPANIYGVGKDSVAITVSTKAFEKLYENVGETGLVYLQVEGTAKDVPVLVDEVQYHPVTGELTHASFKQVDLSEKITAEVPVETIGENNVPSAVVVVVKDVIEVEALPTDLPENFTIDISTLTEIGQSISYKDLSYDKSKVTLMVAEEELENPLVLLEEVKEEVEPEPVAEEAAAEGAAGETPAAEGEKAPEAPAEE